MVQPENQDLCPVCGADLPKDPPDVTLPTNFTLGMTPLADPGVRRVEFCCDRHRRDWLDTYYGMWPETDDPDASK